MSYKGIEMTSQYDYLFSDTQPLNPEFNMEELKKLDPTFRQFCLRENCNESKYYDKTKSRMVAPHPGYFMVSENLIKLGVSEDIAIKTENLAKCIIS